MISIHGIRYEEIEDGLWHPISEPVVINVVQDLTRREQSTTTEHPSSSVQTVGGDSSVQTLSNTGGSVRTVSRTASVITGHR